MNLIFNIGYNLENTLSYRKHVLDHEFTEEEREAIDEVTDCYGLDKEWIKFIKVHCVHENIHNIKMAKYNKLG